MRALITGSSGFVGSYFRRKLIDEGWEVFGVDTIYDGFNHEKFLHVGTDCVDFFNLNNSVFDLVIHLAAFVEGRETIENNQLGIANNIILDIAFFDWIAKTSQPRPVYFSSSAAYPIRLQLFEDHKRLQEDDIDLDDIRSPDLTYGWAKLTGEYLAGIMRSQGRKVYVFRPFSGYGPGQSMNYPFPAIINRVVNKERKFEVWGGSQSRDFVHISDVYATMMKAVESEYSEPLNICTGVRTTFDEFIEIAFGVCNWSPDEIIHRTDKPVGAVNRVGDPENMLKVHQPKVSLQEGIAEMYEVLYAL